jgi:hypothetical protein
VHFKCGQRVRGEGAIHLFAPSLEAHGATVTVSLDEETQRLNIATVLPQKEDFDLYPQ